MSTSDLAILTCALTGVLTNPKQHPVPVTPEEMADEARRAFDAGAAIVHVHFRMQEPGLGHLPSWDPEVAAAIIGAIRARCPGIIINMSTGVVGPDISGPSACMRRVRPEIAACNAGTLNYLKARSDGRWAWPPIVFDNPVDKVQAFLEVMKETGAMPEYECFDLGIVRSVGLFVDVGMSERPHYNFVMGVASGMPADPELLPYLLRQTREGASWEVTAIGREEVWALHQRAAELGGSLRTGLEDTFYLPDGAKATSNGALIEALAACATRAGRRIAGPEEARRVMGLRAADASAS
ncbi:MAG: 3-keto-5-aminohexanoate cleavage protein [Nannocystaceae bacterium]